MRGVEEQIIFRWHTCVHRIFKQHSNTREDDNLNSQDNTVTTVDELIAATRDKAAHHTVLRGALTNAPQHGAIDPLRATGDQKTYESGISTWLLNSKLSVEDEAGGCPVRQKMPLAVSYAAFSGADAPATG